jgi:hypothetical protein
VNEVFIFRIVEPDLGISQSYYHALPAALLGPLDLDFGYVNYVGGHAQSKVLLAFQIKRVQSAVHAGNHQLLLKQQESHWLALDAEHGIRHDLPIFDDVHFPISARYIDSMIHIKLAGALEEAGYRFKGMGFLNGHS